MGPSLTDDTLAEAGRGRGGRLAGTADGGGSGRYSGRRPDNRADNQAGYRRGVAAGGAGGGLGTTGVGFWRTGEERVAAGLGGSAGGRRTAASARRTADGAWWTVGPLHQAAAGRGPTTRQPRAGGGSYGGRGAPADQRDGSGTGAAGVNRVPADGQRPAGSAAGGVAAEHDGQQVGHDAARRRDGGRR